MTDVEINEASEAPAPFVANVPLKFDQSIEVNFDELDIEMYKMLLVEGAKAVLATVGMGKKATGITKLEGATKEKAIGEFMDQVRKNLAGLIDGSLQKGRAKGAKVSGAVAQEALRLAKVLVKDHIRASGQKVGAYSAKEITEAAKKVLEGNKNLLAQAEKNLAERAGEASTTKGLDLKVLFGAKAESDEVKAKPKVAPKRKGADDKPPLSAKQGAMVAPRQKPAGATAH